MTTAADTLRKAAALIEERGLAKGISVERDGRLCMQGAVFQANTLGGNALFILRRLLGGNVPRVNDLPSTTKADAIAWLLLAADAAEAAQL